jgi:hypothetical protein
VRWAALAAALGIVVVGCGGGGKATSAPSGKAPSIEEIASCLEKGGATVTKVLDEEEGAFQMLYAITPEATFNIVNLADPSLDHRMIRFMDKTKTNGGVKGKLMTTTVNEGWTLVGVVAAPETGERLPSAASERLAKSCAVRPVV